MDTYVLDYMVRTLINKIWLLPVLIGLCFLSSAILVSADEIIDFEDETTDFEDNEAWEEDLFIEPLEVVDEDPLPETSVEEPAQENSGEVTDQETPVEEPAQENSGEVTDQENSAAESTQSPNTAIDGDPAVDNVTLHNDNILLTASLYVMSGLLVSMGLVKIML